jgi:hypothetical protein
VVDSAVFPAISTVYGLRAGGFGHRDHRATAEFQIPELSPSIHAEGCLEFEICVFRGIVTAHRIVEKIDSSIRR